MKIALLCPTRNRMNKLLTLISSLITTVKNKDNVVLVLGVDEDDPALENYTYLQRNVPFVDVIIFRNKGKFLGLSHMWNRMSYLKTTCDIHAMVGDDMVFMTKDWDEKIINDFENAPKDKIIMVHCNDGMRGKGNKYENIPPFCVNFFVHKNYFNTVGYFVEPYIENIHQDTWTQYVFDAIGRTQYRHDILIKHLHFSETSQAVDKVTENLEKLREGIWNNSKWFDTYHKEINSDINKLLNYIQQHG